MEIVACMPSLNPTSFITFIANITQLSEIRFNNLQLQFFFLYQVNKRAVSNPYRKFTLKKAHVKNVVVLKTTHDPFIFYEFFTCFFFFFFVSFVGHVVYFFQIRFSHMIPHCYKYKYIHMYSFGA